MSNNCSFSHIRHDQNDYNNLNSIYLNAKSGGANSVSSQNIQIYQFNDDNHTHQNQSQSNQEQVLLIMDDVEDQEENLNESQEEETINSSSNSNLVQLDSKLNSTQIVPALSNVDEIFQLLSQKIAKYCQVLADLTNCEVFYKAQLPLINEPESNKINKTTNSKYKPKNQTNKQIRSLYWGTHQMLFQYSHNQGLKYDKQMGDCLIKINQRSLSSDVNDLIEEILNEPNFSNHENTTHINKILVNNPTSPTLATTKKIYSSNDKKIDNNPSDKVDLRDCVVYLNRLNDSIFDQYLNKFENSNNQINFSNNKHEFEHDLNLPNDKELYSDEYKINFNKILNKNKNSKLIEVVEDDDDYEEDDDEDLDEKSLLVKNCFGLNENEEDYYSCEFCTNHSFKHLTQLKLHQLKCHENVRIAAENGSNKYECSKCKLNEFENYINYIKHMIICFYPDIYSCKTCNQSFSNYSQYLFHTKYVHTHVVYMCAICGRKYRQIKDLLDHDQLMHSKSLNYCEICFEQQKSRKCLYEHYRDLHLNDQVDETINDTKRQSSYEKNFEKAESNELENSQNNQHDLDTQTNLSTIEFVLTESEETIQNKNEKLNSSSSNEWNNKVRKNDLIRGLIDRKHQCKWCSLRFYTKSQLKQHEITHSNTVLLCPVCDKEFTHKDRLSGHMKCHMQPSLECKVCGKKFKRLCNLYNHELVHGLTEHAFMLCQFCGRGFRSRRDYQNHVIANHRDQLMKSDNLNQIGTNNSTFNDNTNSKPKQSKRVYKSQNKTKTQTNSNTNIAQATFQLQNESNHFISTKTTTVVLTDDHITINDSNNNSKSNLILDINEPDTYFTRTGTHDLDIEDEELNEENQDYINDIVTFNLENSESKQKRNNNKIQNSIKNKIKRLKSSLNIEVLDDDDDDDNQNSHLTNQIVNYSSGSNQISYSQEEFNRILNPNDHLVNLND